MRTGLIFGAAHGFLAVALGAFGAHGLGDWLAELPDGAQRLAWWETASHYQLAHAIALVAVAALARDRTTRTCVWAFGLGALIFSGSLYAMTLTGVIALGAITPIGGLALLIGWAALGVAAFRVSPRAPEAG